MEFQEIDLPAVGKKYIINLDNLDIVVIYHNTGKRELYFVKDDEVLYNIEFSENIAKNLGMILTGAFYQTLSPDKVDFIINQVVMEWIKIKHYPKLHNKTIAELDIRKNTGCTIIAVIRDGQFFINPDPYQFKFDPKDTIIVVSNREQLEKFFKYIS
ncbi:MAG: potassium transporter TrkA [bacterium]|nr:potassium transporter TrkA [bacterium]